MKKIVKFAIISLIIAILIEVFICNSQQVSTIFAKQKDIEVNNYSLEEIKMINAEDKIFTEAKEDNQSNSNNIIQNGDWSIAIDDLDYKIYNVKIVFKENYGKIINMYSRAYVYGHEGSELIFGDKNMLANKKDSYINMRTEGDASKLRLVVKNETADELEIEKIIINSTDLNFKLTRVILLFIVIFGILCIKNKLVYGIEYDKSSRKHRYLYYGITAIIASVILLYCINYLIIYIGKYIISEDTNNESMLMQTEAFLNGQLHFLTTPSDGLINASNPYDASLRRSNDISYLFDVSYYNGNYYQYFTALPIILILLPIKLITGFYLGTVTINTLLLILAVFIIAKLFKQLVEKYINKVELFNLILGQVTIILASGLLILMRGNTYEISELCGIISLGLTIITILSLENSNKHKKLKLVLCGISTACIVVSKPTFIAWYILIIPNIFNLNIKQEKDKRTIIESTLSYIVPIIVLAIFQMLYNYGRYESIFEFGAKYQLTIYDMNTIMSLSVTRIIKGAIKYLFAMPKFDLYKFPYIMMNQETNVVNTAMGIPMFEIWSLGLFAVPILWVLFFKNKMIGSKKEDKAEKLKQFSTMVIIISIIIMLLNIVFAGVCEQYCIQYKVMLSIVAILLLMKGLENDKISKKLFLVICVISILIVSPMAFSTLDGWLSKTNSQLIVGIRNLFEVWN